MPGNVARLPSRPARPTIEVGGRQNETLEAALLAYSLTESLDGMAHAELRFGNWGGAERPGLIVLFYDQTRKTIGSTVIAPPIDSSDWSRRTKAIPVPILAREAIVAITLAGGTGELGVDEVAVEGVSR